MKHLFTPWRMKYIKNQHTVEGCVFCDATAGETDGPENLVVYRGENAYVILNRYPYTSGHVMVIPYRHQPDLESLDKKTRAEMMELVNEVIQIIKELYGPQGFNVGINLGCAAGSGIDDHIHIHVVPRWEGDVNFMTAIGNARILPEALDVSWTRISNAWNNS
jgi:ATP adenylyltransferase